MSGRLRGRAGMAQRRRRLALHPFCAECDRRGLTRATEEIDHVLPLHMGGLDVDENVQGLCIPCHAVKSAMEGGGHGGVQNHPDWLERSAVPLCIVAGMPCSGKTTYVAQAAQPRDLVIDLDDIMARLHPGFRAWQTMVDQELFNRAIRVRNAMLGSLSRAKVGQAFFIVAAPTQAERAWWASKLGGRLILMRETVDVCKARAVARGTPAAVAGVDRWVEASRLRWAIARPRLGKVAVGDDGYPVEG